MKPVFQASPKKLPLNSREQQHWNTGNDALASLDIIAISSNKSNRGEVKRFRRIKALVIHTQQTATPKQSAERIATATSCARHHYHVLYLRAQVGHWMRLYSARVCTWSVFAMHIYRHIGVGQSRGTQSNLYRSTHYLSCDRFCNSTWTPTMSACFLHKYYCLLSRHNSNQPKKRTR